MARATAVVVGLVAAVGLTACADDEVGSTPSVDVTAASTPVADDTETAADNDDTETGADTDDADARTDTGPDAGENGAEPSAPMDGFVELSPVAVGVELVATLESAVDLAVRPLDPALHVVEHAGRVVRVDGDDVRVVADLSERLVDHRPEQGLTGLEFSADGEVAWIHYTTPGGTTTVSEVPVDDDGDFDLTSERPLVEIADTPAVNHNAGDLQLLDDGTLLITLGDGHADNDRFRRAADPTTLRGSILRVRPTPSAEEPYEVPDDNPFADGPQAAPGGELVAGAPEVFAWGLRNPWKIDVDPATGSLWVSDVGEDDAEEINAVPAVGDGPAGWSVDFGWSRFEGRTLQNDDVVPVLDEPVDPVHAYAHDGLSCAIAGGVVHRGESIPELASGYVFGDFCAGSVWVYDSTTGSVRALLGADSGRDPIPGISGVRRGPDGDLYVLSWYGEVYRLVAAD